MLYPTKYEDLSKSNLIVSAKIIETLNYEEITIKSLYKKLYSKFNIGFDNFIDCIIFLWLTNVIEINDLIIKRK